MAKKLKNQKLAEQLHELGFEVSNSKENIVDIKSNLGAVFEMMQAVQANELENDKNRERTQRYFKGKSDNGDDWTGGSVADLKRDLSGGIDMEPFLKEKQKLASSGLQDKLKTKIAHVIPRRKRSTSEYDGEWTPDRQWEIKPFMSTTKMLSSGRVIDVICHFGVSASSDADEINAYGALVWAISDLIEASGVQTRITSRYSCRNTGPSVDTEIEIEVKKPGQYIAPNLVAAVFQSNFFRRPVFALMNLACDLQNATSNFGLGSPKQNSTRIAYADGAITLSPNVRHAGAEEIENIIIEAVTGRKTGENDSAAS